MVIGKYKDGILSINFHYLPLPQRYALMAALMKTVKPANEIWEKERLKNQLQYSSGCLPIQTI